MDRCVEVDGGHGWDGKERERGMSTGSVTTIVTGDLVIGDGLQYVNRARLVNDTVPISMLR